MYFFFFYGHIKNGDIMENELLQVSIRSIISLVTLFLVTKMIGKKQVSELSLFDYVIGISIGNFAAEMTINLDSDILHGTLAVVIFGVIAYAISIATMKSIKLRRFFMGVPTVIIENGILLEEGLKKVKYDVNDFLEQCREMGYFDISQIAYAIVECSGELSILPKGLYKNVNIKDLDLKPEEASLLANVIIDGKIMENNLKIMKKDEKWLLKQLKNLGKNKENILLATLDNNEKLLVYDKNMKKSADVLE